MEDMSTKQTPAQVEARKSNKKKPLLITFLVILLLFGVGYGVYAWQQSKINSAESDKAELETKIAQLKVANADLVKKTETTTNATLQSSPSLPFEFEKPANWNIVDNKKELEPIIISSKDLNVQEVPAGGQLVTSGGRIEIFIRSGESTIEKFITNDYMYNKASSLKKMITIDGEKAVQYTVAYEGPSKRITTFFHNGKQIDVSMQADVYQKQAYKEIYDNFLKSIQF
jgi:hypothetical protein